MKKITILLLLLITAFSGMAQTTGLNYSNLKTTPANQRLINSIRPTATLAGTERAVDTGKTWVSYADTIYSLLGGGTFYVEAMFPDSDVIISFGLDQNSDTVWGNIFEHGIANTFNAYSSYFGNLMPTSEGYTLDSIAVGATYSRHTASNIVDTLLINVFQGPYGTSAFPPAYFTSIPDTYWVNHYGSDTVFFPEIFYEYLTLGPLTAYYNGISPAAPITSIKLPLHEADSAAANNIRKVAIPGGLAVTAGNLVGATAAFIPGYAWSPGDTLSNVANVASYFSLDEDLATGEPTYTEKDNNISYADPTQVQYNQSPRSLGGWDSSYIPSYAYNPGYQLQDNYFQYHIKYVISGIKNISSIVSKQSIYPNPASDAAMLSYTLKTGASVTINVYDITGSLIRTFDEGTVIAGTNYKLINTQDLSDGVYLVSVEANGISSVSKLVVSR